MWLCFDSAMKTTMHAYDLCSQVYGLIFDMIDSVLLWIMLFTRPASAMLGALPLLHTVAVSMIASRMMSSSASPTISLLASHAGKAESVIMLCQSHCGRDRLARVPIASTTNSVSDAGSYYHKLEFEFEPDTLSPGCRLIQSNVGRCGSLSGNFFWYLP